MGELESLYETAAGKVIRAHILNLEQKSIVMNPYRSKLPAVNIQARLEPEAPSSNASLSSSVRGERRGGEKKERERKRKSQTVLLTFFFFLLL